MNMNLKLETPDSKEKIDNTKKTTLENKKSTDNGFKKKMIMFMLIIGGVFLLLLLVLFLFSSLTSKKYTYYDVEKIMKNAAVEYYNKHKNRLPGENTTNEGIEVSTLVKGEYMKELTEYLGKNTKCKSGRVTVEKIDGKFIYTPYLECGSDYTTSELYKKVVKKDKIVASGYGLHNMNNEYVFRGQKVNNYIEIDNYLWRIVKVNNDNEIYIIRNDSEKIYSRSWDDRFNTIKNYNSGINDYRLSRLNDYFKKLYNSDESVYSSYEGKLLSSATKEKLKSYGLCIGHRAQDYVLNDNSAECADVLENQMIGALTLSDFLNASTDPECISPLSKSCQNYNYLVIDADWWLTTAAMENTYSVYRVTDEGFIEIANATSIAKLRPVIKLSNRVMYMSGNGSLKKPYKIR